MAKPHVAQRKAQMLASREAERNRQLAASAAATMAAEQAKAPVILLTPEASLFNGVWFSKWRRGVEAPANLTLPAHTFPGIPGDFFLFPDLEERLDTGQAGLTLMGALEVFVIRDFGEIQTWDRKRLGLPAWTDRPPHLQLKTRDGGLADMFEKRRNSGAYGPVERLTTWNNFQSGKWASGAPQVLDDVLPIEVIFDHRNDRIIAVRSLKDAVPESVPAEAAQPIASAEAGTGAEAPASAAPAPAAPAATSAAPATAGEIARARSHDRKSRRAANAADTGSDGVDLEAE